MKIPSKVTLAGGSSNLDISLVSTTHRDARVMQGLPIGGYFGDTSSATRLEGSSEMQGDHALLTVADRRCSPASLPVHCHCPGHQDGDERGDNSMIKESIG